MPLLYVLDSQPTFGQALAAHLGLQVARHEDRAFPDGEHKLRPLTDPRGRDAYVLCSLYGGPEQTPNESPHDKLLRLLMFIAVLRDHGAARISALVPYLAYARKDRQTQAFDPVGVRYVAQLFEAVGVDQIMVLEAHNIAAFQSAFRCNTIHLEAHRAFELEARKYADQGRLAVASPDPGGVKRAQLWREGLEQSLQQPVGFAFADKRRSAGMLRSDNLIAGEVAGMTVLLLDDIIASGETMVRAAHALRRAGAGDVVAFAAHGLFNRPAIETLADGGLSHIVVTDSVPAFRLASPSSVFAKLSVATAVPLFAEAIANSHSTWQR